MEAIKPQDLHTTVIKFTQCLSVNDRIVSFSSPHKQLFYFNLY